MRPRATSPRASFPALRAHGGLAALAATLAFAHGAGAASASVQFSSGTYTVSQNAGQALITLTRTGSLAGSQSVSYGTARTDSAPAGLDFTNVSGVLEFAAGSSQASFRVPVTAHDFSGPPVAVALRLYQARPDPLGAPGAATLQILHDAPLARRVAGNPLGLTPAPGYGNVLAGARFYVDRWGSPAGRAELSLQASDPAAAAGLSVIASAPWAVRFGAWNGPDPSVAVFLSLEKASGADPGAVPMIASYRIVGGQCAHGVRSDSPAQVRAYQRFADGLADGIGNFRAVLFLEMDSLITTPCLSARGVAVRMAELRYAISALQRDPHVVVYVDGGAADALPYRTTAALLERAGVRRAQGFFLNATHADWTSSEIAYGQRISLALGDGVHFVVNTAAAGRGPLVPASRVRDGNEVLCNPPGRGLGPKTTTSTGYLWVDAFAWMSNPGGSGGACVPGAPASAQFWASYALMLVRNADFAVSGPGIGSLLRLPRGWGRQPWLFAASGGRASGRG